MGGSSLARASALSQNSSSRQQSQGKGGSNQTTAITGPTDNINRGGSKGVDTSNKPSTQKAAEAKEKKTADGRGRNKISQGTPQERYKDVLTQLKEHAAQRLITKLSEGGEIQSTLMLSEGLKEVEKGTPTERIQNPATSSMIAHDQDRGSWPSKSGHHTNHELETDKEGGKSAEEGAKKIKIVFTTSDNQIPSTTLARDP